STNYNAYALDALVYSRMILHPKVEPKIIFKDGWFIHDYQKIVQPIFFFDKDRNDSEGKGIMKFKGIKKILEERDMRNSQKLDCKKKEGDEK
ncbi:2466_t:CDS:2, partial [Gigaspora rosea]